jgi:hypothetical protein
VKVQIVEQSDCGRLNSFPIRSRTLDQPKEHFRVPTWQAREGLPQQICRESLRDGTCTTTPPAAFHDDLVRTPKAGAFNSGGSRSTLGIPWRLPSPPDWWCPHLYSRSDGRPLGQNLFCRPMSGYRFYVHLPNDRSKSVNECIGLFAPVEDHLGFTFN